MLQKLTAEQYEEIVEFNRSMIEIGQAESDLRLAELRVNYLKQRMAWWGSTREPWYRERLKRQG